MMLILKDVLEKDSARGELYEYYTLEVEIF